MNKVMFGISKVHTSALTETATSTFAVPVPISGAVSMSLTPQNEAIAFEADNDPNFFAKMFNKGYQAELVMAIIPDEFKIAYLGYRKNTSGTIFEDPSAVTKPFALLWQVEGDAEPTRFCLYKCVAGRPTLTQQSGSAINGQSVPLTTGKPTGLSYVLSYCTETANKVAYDKWFTAVQLDTTV